MRKTRVVLALAAVLLLVSAAPSYAWSRGWHGHPGVRSGVFIGVGPSFWWGPPYPYWYYPPPYYVYSPPAVIVEEPPVYTQQQPASPPTPPTPQPYWYYCASANAYYPNVQTCPEAWVKVPPRPQ